MADNTAPVERRKRVDAQRNLHALLEAAKAVFATLGVDAPARDVADQAGVGVGTLYRHFPTRAALVVAVLEQEIDACADAAPILAANHEAAEALAAWLSRYTTFLETKDGLATALHKGEPAFDGLVEHLWQRFAPALGSLLEAAASSGEIRSDVSSQDLLAAVGSLCLPVPGVADGYSRRMVSVLIDGLRHDAKRAA